ncbi:hypothetical protein ACXIUS_30245 [Bosea thiooxidans]
MQRSQVPLVDFAERHMDPELVPDSVLRRDLLELLLCRQDCRPVPIFLVPQQIGDRGRAADKGKGGVFEGILGQLEDPNQMCVMLDAKLHSVAEMPPALRGNAKKGRNRLDRH